MLTVDRLREVLHYEPSTGVFTWLVNTSKRRHKGLRAGSPNKSGHWAIGIDGKAYYAHRLAALYMTGTWPARGVDHKNVTPGDNRWENLRPADQSQNGANAPLGAKNTSGFKGVSWHKQSSKWRADIMVRGTQMFLGRFLDREEAHAAYVAAADKYHGEFARAA